MTVKGSGGVGLLSTSAVFDLLHHPHLGVKGMFGTREGLVLQHPARRSQPKNRANAKQAQKGWLGFQVSRWVLWGRGQAPIRGITVKPWGVALCPTV